jgi:hypothetical protein
MSNRMLLWIKALKVLATQKRDKNRPLRHLELICLRQCFAKHDAKLNFKTIFVKYKTKTPTFAP